VYAGLVARGWDGFWRQLVAAPRRVTARRTSSRRLRCERRVCARRSSRSYVGGYEQNTLLCVVGYLSAFRLQHLSWFDIMRLGVGLA
jgi:hypothetical protein